MRSIYIFIAVFISPLLCWNIATYENKTIGNSFKKIKKEVLKIAKKQNVPAFDLYIQQEEKVLQVTFHHPELKPQTVYGIGSTTKFLAATLIFKLIEDGKLNLNDPISKYLEETLTIENASEITIKQLLNHTSGLHDYTKNPKWIQNVINAKAPQTFTEKIALINTKLSTTGTFAYSNTNYLFLEKIVSTITQKPFEKAFNEFYQNLGFKTIQIGSIPEDAIAFFAQDNKGSSNVSGWREHYGFDGGAYATVKELNQFLHKIFIEKTILTQETLDTIQTWIPMKPMTIPIGIAGKLDEYGYGMMKLTYKGQTYIGHSGGTLKYQSFLFYNEITKTSVSFVTNCSGRHYNNVFFQEMIPAILDKL